MKKYKIYLAEYEVMFSSCLKTSLERDQLCEVVGVTSNGITAFNEIRKSPPNILLTGLNLDKISGVDLIRKVKASCPQTRVILLTSKVGPHLIHQVLSAGVDGILLKNDPLSLLFEAISVIDIRKFLSPGISDPLVNNFISINDGSGNQKISPLSDREEQVSRLIGEGISSKEIAVTLCISEKTVSKHRGNIFRKLNIKNSAQLVRYVYENNLIDF